MAIGAKEKKLNFLLIRLGGLGDLMIIVPSIQLIKKNIPHAELTLVARLSYGDFLKEAGMVEALLPLENGRASFLFQEEGETPGYGYSDYDLVIVWLNKELISWRKILEKKFGNKLKIITGKEEQKLSLARYFLIKTAEFLDIEIGDELKEQSYGYLPLKEQWINEAEKLFPWLKSHSFVVVHPGSGGLEKRWKLENFLRLVDFFVEKKLGGIFVTGPAEEEYRPMLSTYKWPERWGWVHAPRLSLICGLLSRSQLYIGNDSGITHLAALCGSQGLSFFREENFPLWSPYTKKMKIIVAPQIEEIPFYLVCQEIRTLLGHK